MALQILNRRTIGCAALSAAVVWGLHFVSVNAGQERQIENARRWSEQVLVQADGLVIAARARGDKDPLSSALGVLSQSRGDRVFQVARRKMEALEPTESFRLAEDPRSFVYSRVMILDERAGLDVTIPLERVGFLGTSSRVAGDFALVLCFYLVFCAFHLAINRIGGGVGGTALRESTLGWVQDFRAILIALGTHVRELVREAQKLAVSASKSRTSVETLRSRIHLELGELHEARQTLREAAQSANQAEIVALNLVIEAARLEQRGAHFGGMSEELHRLVQQVKKLASQSEGVVGKLEIALEPIATEADLALQAYTDVFQTTQSMDGHIRKTTEAMLGQARILQGVKDSLQGGKAKQLPERANRSEDSDPDKASA